MPTYDYECDACGHKYELFQSITEEPVKKCPACGKKKARRLFGTGAAIMFKGSGFYQTDYRSESYKKGAKADNDSANGGAKPADSGSKSSDSGSKSSDSGSKSSDSGSSQSSKAEAPKRKDKGSAKD